MNKFIVIISLICIFLLSFFSCFPDHDGQNGEDGEINLDKFLLDLPEAVSAPMDSAVNPGFTGNRTNGFESSIIESLSYIFSPVRNTYNPLADGVIRFTRLYLSNINDLFFKNNQRMGQLQEEGVVELAFDDNRQKARLEKNDNDYVIEVWKVVMDKWIKYLDVRFSKDGSRYLGTIHVRDEIAESGICPEYRIDFDTQDLSSGHSMQLYAVNLNHQSPESGTLEDDSNIPSRLWLNVWSDSKIFYIAANIYYLNIDIESDSYFYNYLMTVLNGMKQFIPGVSVVNGNYIYRGVVDILRDRGAIDLALVPEVVTETQSVFSDYSIGQIYKEAIAEWIRKDRLNNTTMTLVQSVNHLLEAVESDLRISSSSTTGEIMEALEIIYQNYDSIYKDYEDIANYAEQINDILFILQIVNPGYFDSKKGFIGNYRFGKPAWADSLPRFDSLEVKSAAEVSSDNFKVEMPDDKEPDF